MANHNDALLYRLQQMNLNSDFQNPRQQGTANGIYENVEYTSGAGRVLVTDLDAIDTKKFESNNAKAQPQLKPSSSGRSFGSETENIRFAHTPQPSDAEAPIYENLQVVSGKL